MAAEMKNGGGGGGGGWGGVGVLGEIRDVMRQRELTTPHPALPLPSHFPLPPLLLLKQGLR